MADATGGRTRAAWGSTDRRDVWWLEPLATVVVLSSFVVYATTRALLDRDYQVGALLSPFYSPDVERWTPLPSWLSPALVILWAPAGFRLTCYYYRKAYYRGFAQHPTACAVAEPKRGHYCGETRFPLVLQNLHRYLLYVALLFLVFLWHDAWVALWPGGELGVTVGTLVLTGNAALLTGYTLSCHSLRHLVGGKLDCFSCSGLVRIRYRAWRGVSRLNEGHMLWAWASLVMVMAADAYVWAVASGAIHDARIL